MEPPAAWAMLIVRALRWRRLWSATSVAATALVVLCVADARGFGTVNSFGGQNNEHERITRAALACPVGAVPDGNCFEPATLDQLAGRSATAQGSREAFGGVG